MTPYPTAPRPAKSRAVSNAEEEPVAGKSPGVETETQHREHEEAIAPVRPSFGTAGGEASGSFPDEPEEGGFGIGRPLLAAVGVLLAAAVIGVFVLLPRWVQQDGGSPAPQAAAPAKAPPAPPKPTLTPEQEKQLADQTESLLAKLLTQQQSLKEMSVASWGGADYTSYTNASKAGDDAYLNKSYQDAIAAYGKALDIGKDLLARSAEITQKALDAGRQALEVGNAALAGRQFALVLAVDAGNAAAKAGQARAKKLPDVLALMREGDALRERGLLANAAEAYSKAAAIDPEWKPANESLAEVRQRIADEKFEGLMSKGFSALGSKDYSTAEQQFKTALAMRPKSADARDGLVQARQGLQLGRISLARIRALAFERRELWDRAIEQYQAALAEDPSLDFAKKGLAHAQKREDLDAKLENLIGHPQLLFGDEVLAAARGLLEQARAVADPGSRLKGQISALDGLIHKATTPVTVELKSDQQTEVTVYRVGRLGTFDAKELQLRPGQYVAIGSRDGYRDVRKTFTVQPGRAPDPVSVVCTEQI